MRRYVFAVLASKKVVTPEIINNYNNVMPVQVDAENEYEAMGLATKAAKQCYPEKDGWSHLIQPHNDFIVTKENIDGVRLT